MKDDTIRFEGTDFESFATAVGMVLAVVVKQLGGDAAKVDAALETLEERIEGRSDADSRAVAEAAKMLRGGINTFQD